MIVPVDDHPYMDERSSQERSFKQRNNRPICNDTDEWLPQLYKYKKNHHSNSCRRSIRSVPCCSKAWASVWSFSPWLHRKCQIVSSCKVIFAKCVKLHTCNNFTNTTTLVWTLIKWANFWVKNGYYVRSDKTIVPQEHNRIEAWIDCGTENSRDCGPRPSVGLWTWIRLSQL